MQLARPAIAIDPRQFGRGQLRECEPARPSTSNISPDLKLFATTFLCGFVFVSILIG